MPTLSTPEILLDIIEAFKTQFPAFNRMGLDLRPNSLKLKQTYTAHIPTLPVSATYDTTTGYANGAQEARNLLTDLPIKVINHKHVPLKFTHLSLIQDNKIKYDQTIKSCGYVLAKEVIDSMLTKVNARSFSQESVFTEANSDYDMLNNVTGDLNAVGAMNMGRTMIVNTAVANVLGVDARVASREYAAQQQGEEGYRTFRNLGGFGEIVEYPGLSTNNGATLTAVAGTASSDLLSKTDHGLNTGDPFVITFSSGYTGLTTATKYYAIRIDDDTFKVASTYALALAGTPIDITADGTGATVTLSNNLIAFGFDPRACALLAGIPDDFGAMIAELGITQVMNFEAVTDPETGLTMAAVKWQQAGTGDLFWSPTLVWGSRVGKEPAPDTPNTTLAVGSGLDYAGHRVISA